MKISPNAIIKDGVKLGKNVIIEDFSIIGITPISSPEKLSPTTIGPNSNIKSHAVIYTDNSIGENFFAGHRVMIRESNKIGNNVSIGSHSMIEHHIVLEDGVRIHSNVFIPEYSIIEESSWLGPSVTLTNAAYPKSANAKNKLVGPRIHRGAIIGAGVTILPGVSIGINAFVGAGSVVVDHVPDNHVVVGNPAKFIKFIYDIPDYNQSLPEK